MFSASFYDKIIKCDLQERKVMKVKVEEFLVILSEVISKERKKLNMTQTELALKSGLNRTYISDIECGKRNPTLNVLLQISEALGLSLSVLMLKVELEKGDFL